MTTQPVTVKSDAKNRATRTFVQGLEIDLGVSTAALVLAEVGTITTRAGLITFGISLVKTILTSAASYVMRRYLDSSVVPTPAPEPLHPSAAYLQKLEEPTPWVAPEGSAIPTTAPPVA